jgi:hypothetical protein
MRIAAVRTKLYTWKGPVKIDDTVFATPLSALAALERGADIDWRRAVQYA